MPQNEIATQDQPIDPGTLEAVHRVPSKEVLQLRILAKCQEVASGCWEWTGSKTPDGYGKIQTGTLTKAGNRKPDFAHRASYVCFVGPIADGLEIDHLCRNRACVNPAHLEAVDHQTNVLRGESVAAKYARSSLCKHGHEKSPENTYTYPKGTTSCRICRAKLAKEFERKRRAK